MFEDGEQRSIPLKQQHPCRPKLYFSFFLGRNWFVCPHFFLRQLVARGWRRA